MRKYKIIKPLKIKSITKTGKYILRKISTNNEICENYYRVNDKYGDGRGEY